RNGEIACYLGEAAQVLFAVVERRNDDVRPECAPVLAQTPAFLLVTTAGARGRKLVCRPIAGHVLGGEKTRTVRADNFRARIAVNVLCARIPTRNVSGSVEPEDRIVL